MPYNVTSSVDYKRIFPGVSKLPNVLYCATRLISMTLLLIKEEMISLASAEYVAVYMRPGARYYIASVSSFVYQLSSNP